MGDRCSRCQVVIGHIGFNQPDGTVCGECRVAELEARRDKFKELANDFAKRIAELEAKLAWISVEDLMPIDGQFVLIWKPSYLQAQRARFQEGRKPYLGDGCFRWFGDNGHIFLGPYEGITHWMPLPEPPKEGDDAKV